MDATGPGAATAGGLDLTGRLQGMLAAHLRAVPPDVDWASITLPELGLDSMSAIELVLAIEEVLEVRFPEPLLVRETFVTLASLESAVRSLVDSP